MAFFVDGRGQFLLKEFRIARITPPKNFGSLIV